MNDFDNNETLDTTNRVGLIKRFVAYFIDSTIFTFLLFPIFLAFNKFDLHLDSSYFKTYLFPTFFIMIFLFELYNVFLIAKYGKTLGCKKVKFSIIHKNERSLLTLNQSLKRRIPFIGLSLFSVLSSSICYHQGRPFNLAWPISQIIIRFKPQNYAEIGNNIFALAIIVSGFLIANKKIRRGLQDYLGNSIVVFDDENANLKEQVLTQADLPTKINSVLANWNPLSLPYDHAMTNYKGFVTQIIESDKSKNELRKQLEIILTETGIIRNSLDSDDLDFIDNQIIETCNFLYLTLHPKKQKSIVIDGASFSTLEEFYIIIEQNFTDDLDWSIGRNLDGLNDIMRGGFGVHDYNEPITIIWKDHELSKSSLYKYDHIIDIMQSHNHIILELK